MAEKNAKKKSQSSGNASATSVEENRNTVLESHGYRVSRNIGKGSYATVKLAESDQHSGAVAIKIVSKFQAPSDYLKKFLPREIQVVKGLTHPNLIKFHQAIETTHRVYIIMEFAENGSLLEMIQKDSHIDEPRARNWYHQLLNAIEFCHSNGVVHRDIKCENLLMNSDYQLKLSDFGFARGNMGTIESKYVLSDTFCGSYAYASPEILRGVLYRPQYADIWSSGVVLYATVFGRLPFDDSNYNSLLKQVQKPVNFPREPAVSHECKALLRKILAPLQERLRIPGIREDSWMRIGESRSSKSSVKSNKATPKPVVTKDEDEEDDVSKESVSKESLSKESVNKEKPKKKPAIKLQKQN